MQVDRAEAGLRHGRIPFGWRDPGEAVIVREITARLLAGDSLRTITRDLNGRAVPAPAGGPWSGTQVRQIAARAGNAGLRRHQGTVVGAAAWPPLVARGDWERVVRLLADPGRRTHSGTGRRWLLSGILRCSVCGQGVTRALLRGRDGKSDRAVYRCKQMCTSVSAVASDGFVLGVVAARLARPDAAGALAGDTAGIAALEAELAVLDARATDAALAYAGGEIDRSMLATITARIGTDREAVTGRLRGLERRAAVLPDPGTMVGELPLDRQRALIRVLAVPVLLPALRRGGAPPIGDRIRIDWR